MDQGSVMPCETGVARSQLPSRQCPPCLVNSLAMGGSPPRLPLSRTDVMTSATTSGSQRAISIPRLFTLRGCLATDSTLIVGAADGSFAPEQIGYLAVSPDGELSVDVEDGDWDAYSAPWSLRADGTLLIPVCLSPTALDLQQLRRALSPEQPFGLWLAIIFGHCQGSMNPDRLASRRHASEVLVACANLALYLVDIDRESHFARALSQLQWRALGYGQNPCNSSELRPSASSGAA